MIQKLNRFLRINEVEQFVGLKRTTIKVQVKAGTFPRPIPLTDNGHAKGWLESDLVAWQNERIAKAQAEPTE